MRSVDWRCAVAITNALYVVLGAVAVVFRYRGDDRHLASSGQATGRFGGVGSRSTPLLSMSSRDSCTELVKNKRQLQSRGNVHSEALYIS